LIYFVLLFATKVGSTAFTKYPTNGVFRNEDENTPQVGYSKKSASSIFVKKRCKFAKTKIKTK
jgi:hypothetical protein